ncbi:MAG: hypothetical protein WCG28_02005, partial [bacterium]
MFKKFYKVKLFSFRFFVILFACLFISINSVSAFNLSSISPSNLAKDFLNTFSNYYDSYTSELSSILYSKSIPSEVSVVQAIKVPVQPKPVVYVTPQPTTPPNKPLLSGEGKGEVSESNLASTLKNLLSKQEYIDLLRGPQGVAGPKGDSGQSIYYPSNSSGQAPSIQPAYIGVIQPNPSANFSGATLFSATNLSSNQFTTSTAHITDITVSGSSILKGAVNIGGALNVTGNSTLTGDLAITGTLVNPIVTPAESWIGPSSIAGVYFTAGNVGIGTTTPTSLLSVGST